MDTHPIPQNVTSFQFRLIGDMTLKQFMYLAFGLGVAYVNFVFVSTSLPLIAWPMIISSSFLGIAFAFLPVAERPLDYWLASFLKAVYSPTKRVWSKAGKNYDENALFIKRLDLYARNHFTTPPAVVIPKIQPQIARPLAAPTATQPTPPSTQAPTTEELSKTVELAKQAQSLQMQIVQTQKKLDTLRQGGTMEEVNQILTGLHQLVGQASQIKQQLAAVTHEAPLPTAPTEVQVVTAPRPKPTQIILTSTPNVINGIVTDAANNYLEAVVVVIYDKDGLPVRALKTNKLGQFSGATPLPNGRYTVQLEKDNLSFDALQITLAGNVLPPLMISAKKLL